MAQIKGFAALVGSQEGLLPPEIISRNTAGMVDSLDMQIRSLSLSNAEAYSLNVAIASGVFSQDQKTRLATSISERVSLAPDGASNGRTQTLTNVLAYFSAQDWAVFEDNTLHLSCKIGRITERCRLLGLTNPSESTIKHLSAIIASTHCPAAEPAAMHAIVVDIKKGLHNVTSVTTSRLTKYPPVPADLPDHLYEAAYRGDPPIVKILDSFGAVAAKTPMRSSNRALSVAPLSQGNLVERLLVQLRNELQPPSNRIQLTKYGESIVARGHAAAGSSGDALGGGYGNLSPVHTPPNRLALQYEATSPLGVVAHGAGSWPLHQAGAASVAVVPVAQPAVAARIPPSKKPPLTPIDGASAAADADADDAVSRLEALAAKAADGATGDSKKKGCKKKPAAATAGGSAAATSSGSKPMKGVMKRPAAVAQKVPRAKTIAMGCGKCRGSPSGCSQCRDPGFSGKRWCRKK